MPNPEPKNASAQGRPGDPCVFVIFGATGDLTKRLLMPALYNLLANKLLPDKFAIVGVSNVEMSSEDFRKQLGEEIGQFATTKVSADLWKWFDQRISYMAGDFKDPATYTKLKSALEAADKEHGTPGNYLFYTAVSPSFFGEIVKQLAGAGLTKEADGHWRRVIIEKPFGHDLESANALNREIGACSTKTRSTASITISAKKPSRTSWRFASATASSSRCGTTVTSTTCKSPTRKPSASSIAAPSTKRPARCATWCRITSWRSSRWPRWSRRIRSTPSRCATRRPRCCARSVRSSPKTFRSWAVRGQYGPGTLEGKPVPGYRAEPQVNPKSGTETYVALKLAIDNWRWAGVPFYLRTGKRMAKRVTEIAIKFKAPPALLFRQTGVKQLEQNELVMHIQPDEGISLSFSAKIPGPVVKLGGVDMNFKYADYFGSAPSTGYETLLLDCMLGDPALFQRADTVDAGWRVVDPILDAWKQTPAADFPNYAAGSAGPSAADELLKRDGRKWRDI